MTPAEELRAAATCPTVAEPIATWLTCEAELAEQAHLWADREPCGWCGIPAGEHALAVARQILATQPDGSPR